MSERAIRLNANKLRWSLIDFKSLEEMLQVLEFGAIKYAPGNWKKGLNREEVLESLQRHLAKLFEGQEEDGETKLHHMGHIMCNAMFYLYHHRNNTFCVERNNPFTKS